MNPEDFSSVFRTIKQSNPNEIYFLAGQSSVGLSFEQPAETIQSNVSSVLNILETLPHSRAPHQAIQRSIK